MVTDSLYSDLPTFLQEAKRELHSIRREARSLGANSAEHIGGELIALVAEMTNALERIDALRKSLERQGGEDSYPLACCSLCSYLFPGSLETRQFCPNCEKTRCVDLQWESPDCSGALEHFAAQHSVQSRTVNGVTEILIEGTEHDGAPFSQWVAVGNMRHLRMMLGY